MTDNNTLGAPSGSTEAQCRRCGMVYTDGTVMCGDPSAPGAGSVGVCGGTVAAPIATEAPAQYSRQEFENDRMGETGEINAASRRLPSAAPAGAPAPTEPERLLLNSYGRRCYVAGYESAERAAREAEAPVGPPARLQELLAAKGQPDLRATLEQLEKTWRERAEFQMGEWGYTYASAAIDTCADELEALLSSSAGAAKSTKTKT